jgi:hypothetical protein
MVPAWTRKHPRLVVTTYAAVFAAVAFALSRPVLLVNDGHMYFEMARSMSRGALEFDNGLDVVDSPELWMQNAVKIGRHLYSKYPPLYALIAAGPYAWLGIRGLYLVNAIGFVVALPAFHELARRVLGARRAAVATLLTPFTLPLAPYMLMELPHLVALAAVLWAVVAWDAARRSPSGRGAFARGLAAGVLAGVAVGVRVQDLVLVLPLFVLGLTHSRARWRMVGGLAAGLTICIALVAVINFERFGSLNPFSYGPADVALGAPHPEERVSFFLRPSVAVDFVILVGVLFAVRLCRRGALALAIAAAGAGVIALVAPLRATVARMVESIAAFVLNANIAGAGWSTPDTTHGWVNKALLSSTPFLVLGLVGALACAGRRAPPLQTLLAWMVIILILFLSVREPDPRTERAVIGFLSLSPRYLVEIMPALYLLAWDRLRNVRVGAAYLVLGFAVGAVLFVFMSSTGQDDLVQAKLPLLITDSIVAACLLVLAYACRRLRVGAIGLGVFVAITNGYAAACAYGEDALCLLTMAAVHERWGKRVLAAMPEPRVALVGWHYAKDALFHIRSNKSVIVVDPAVDDVATLRETLDALVASGRKPYYFGLKLERVRPYVEREYRIVPVLVDPLLWRFDRIEGTD